MSFHREHVIWQSKSDKQWYIGFYPCYSVGDDSDPEWDSEWDVEYEYDRFEWASGPHRSEEAARRSWKGANPGGGEIFTLEDEDCHEFDRLFKRYSDPAFLEEDNKRILKVEIEKTQKRTLEQTHPSTFKAGEPVSVTALLNGRVHKVEGRLRLDGQWLCINSDKLKKPLKVYNTSTKKLWKWGLNSYIGHVHPNTLRRYQYGYRYGY